MRMGLLRRIKEFFYPTWINTELKIESEEGKYYILKADNGVLLKAFKKHCREKSGKLQIRFGKPIERIDC